MNQLENNQENSLFEKVKRIPTRLVALSFPFFFLGYAIIMFPFMVANVSRWILKELKEEEESLKNNNL